MQIKNLIYYKWHNKKQKNANFFVKTLKNHGRWRLFSKESIENIKIYNKNKGILSNNFDRTKQNRGKKKWEIVHVAVVVKVKLKKNL